MYEVVTAISLWELVKHVGSWVINLKRAKDSRKKESVDALRKVVIAARRTLVYMRQIKDTGNKSHQIESELSVLWSELSFALEDLDLEKLAKRCRVTGKHWADPSQTDDDYLEKADVGLAKIEQMATRLLQEIKA